MAKITIVVFSTSIPMMRLDSGDDGVRQWRIRLVHESFPMRSEAQSRRRRRNGTATRRLMKLNEAWSRLRGDGGAVMAWSRRGRRNRARVGLFDGRRGEALVEERRRGRRLTRVERLRKLYPRARRETKTTKTHAGWVTREAAPARIFEAARRSNSGCC